MKTQENERMWSSKLLSCQADWQICCRTLWCPWHEHALHGQLIFGENFITYCIDVSLYCLLCFTCLEWTLGWFRRRELRAKYNLSEAPMEDCTLHILCHCCAMCQESRQLKTLLREDPDENDVSATPPPQAELTDASNQTSNTGQAVVFERHVDYIIDHGEKLPTHATETELTTAPHSSSNTGPAVVFERHEDYIIDHGEKVPTHATETELTTAPHSSSNTGAAVVFERHEEYIINRGVKEPTNPEHYS